MLRGYRTKTINGKSVDLPDSPPYTKEFCESIGMSWEEDQEYHNSFEYDYDGNPLDSMPTSGESLAQQLEENDALKFPRGAIKGLAARYADIYTECFESPWSFWAFSLLTCFGLVLADRVYLEAGNSPQPRLFTILLGRSGYERKSEAIRQTVRLFHIANGTLFERCETVGSAEGLMKAFESQKKVLLEYDELQNFVNKSSIDGSTLLTTVNSLFEMNSCSNRIRREQIKIDEAYLSILAACTTETFGQMWKPNYIDIGFINRLWLVPDRGERRFATPKTIKSTDEMLIIDRIKAFTDQYKDNPTVIRTENDAYDLWNQWYMEQDYSAYNTRLDTYGDRLKVLFCINEGKRSVDAEMMGRIIELVKWQRVVREACSPIDAQGKVARVEENIRRQLGKHGPMKKWLLKEQVNAKRDGIWVLDAALKNLIMAGEVEVRLGKYTLIKVVKD